MTKHRRITGFVAIALLAAVAATMRSQSPSTGRSVAPGGMMSFKELPADVKELPTEDLSDRSPVYSTNP
jgi:hypothetical protein